MAISGIVITLARADSDPAGVQAWLASQPDLELGEAPAAAPERLPGILDAPSSRAAARRLVELERHPGVLKVDVVHVGFEETDEIPANPFTPRAPRNDRSRTGPSSPPSRTR